MSATARVEPRQGAIDAADAMNGAARARAVVFEASFETVLHDQDAPRAWSAINCRLAMTRLARANRLNNRASFLAKPLWRTCLCLNRFLTRGNRVMSRVTIALMDALA